MDYSGKIIKKTPVTPSQTSASGVWTLDDAAQAQRTNTWPVPNVPNPISRSLRFRSSASASLTKTFSTDGTSNTIQTISAWVKRGQLGSNQVIMGGYDAVEANQSRLQFTSSDTINLRLGGSSANDNITTAVFRDPSAWYHIVASIDTTQATLANRAKIYVNGVQQTVASPSCTQNQITQFANGSTGNTIGEVGSFGSTWFDGYMTEFYFIDGQALDPTYFGGTNATTGVWEPRVYTGTYGTNGFYLNFKDNTSTTTLGYDYSGNGNNWTTNNISLTAGSTYDSMLDVPTQWIGYGNAYETTRGNYAVLNPLRTNGGTVTNGNLTASQAASAYVGFSGSMAMRTGKWYWEVTCTSIGFVTSIGITNSNSTSGFTSGIWTYHYDGTKYIGASNSAYGASYTSGDVLGFAFDADAGSLTCYKNNVSQGVLVSGLSANDYYAYATLYGTWNMAFNFGQRPFSYTPPSGYLPLCTTNLSSPTILQGDDYFNATLYTGTGANQTITNAGGVQPDLVWVKVRSTTGTHVLTDSVRGANKQLYSNLTNAEGTATNKITGFTSTGFTLGADDGTGTGDANFNGSTYVGWQWRASGSTVSNTSGSITSTVSANQTAGFSIVTYTGNGTSPSTVGHGLGTAPSMMIFKARSVSGNSWDVYHQSLGNDKYLLLDSTAAAATSSWLNNTSPSSTVFTLSNFSDTNSNGVTYVAYCFAAVAGYSAFGSYAGNGSADGAFVYTGFRPKFVMIRSTSNLREWFIVDTSRSTYNVANLYLRANTSAAQGTDTVMDILSNGFKMRNSDTAFNGSGETYIYMAFAENPFKNALAR